MTGSEPDTSRDVASRRARRGPRRTTVIAGMAAVLVVALGGAALTDNLPGVPLREGPLEGTNGVAARMQVRATDSGAIWGNLILENHSGSTIVLDSIEVAQNPQHLEQLTAPYIWDEGRVAMLGFSTVDGYQLPLPAEWNLPPRHPVEGYELKSTDPPQPDDDTIKDVEVLLEFGVPEQASPLIGITVNYHVGWLAYRKTFDISFTLCPPTDPQPCKS